METREKRRSPRVRAAKGASGRIKQSVPVTIHDVSLLGMRLELETALRPNQLYDLKADLNGTPFTAQVRITRCTAGGFGKDAAGARVIQYSAGVEFVDLAPVQRLALESYVEKARTPRHPSSGTISRISK